MGRQGGLRNCVARRRKLAGLRQQDVAARAGVSRQTLSIIEAGRSVPSADVALRLAAAFQCKVEDLFWADEARSFLVAEWAAAPVARITPQSRGDGQRVTLASLNGRWVAHPLSPLDEMSLLNSADGVATGTARKPKDASAASTRINLLVEPGSVRDTLLCSGCAPSFGILAARLNAAGAGVTERVRWLDRSSTAALELLARGQIHVAGAHLYDAATDEFNVSYVRARFPNQSMLLYNLARWDAGLAVPSGNPRRIRGVRDLMRKGMSIVRRQRGAAAQELLERLCASEGLRPASRLSGPEARSHWEAGRLVALGLADAGMTLPSVARALDLAFIPLAAERFDLVVPKALSGDPRIGRLLDTLHGRTFRRELETLGGHETRQTGRLVAETGVPGTSGR